MWPLAQHRLPSLVVTLQSFRERPSPALPGNVRIKSKTFWIQSSLNRSPYAASRDLVWSAQVLERSRAIISILCLVDLSNQLELPRRKLTTWSAFMHTGSFYKNTERCIKHRIHLLENLIFCFNRKSKFLISFIALESHCQSVLTTLQINAQWEAVIASCQLHVFPWLQVKELGQMHTFYIQNPIQGMSTQSSLSWLLRSQWRLLHTCNWIWTA